MQIKGLFSRFFGTKGQNDSPEAPRRTDPAIYQKMREKALEMRFAGYSENQVQVVLMDWVIGKGIATVLAAVDGSASIYLSSGGGYLGGGQGHASIRMAAQRAIAIATSLADQFEITRNTNLPQAGTVNFFIRRGDELLTSNASEEMLSNGTDPLTKLGNAMQSIVTEYRKTAQ